MGQDGFKIFPNGKIELSMGIHNGKREKPIVLYASHIPLGSIKELELCYDQGLYLSISFDDGVEKKSYTPGQAVAIDLGEIHTLSCFSENGEALIVTGRKLRSIHRLRNKKVGELSRLQSKCKKGSSYETQLSKLAGQESVSSKAANGLLWQLQDALHKTTKQLVNWCIQQSMSDVFCRKSRRYST